MRRIVGSYTTAWQLILTGALIVGLWVAGLGPRESVAFWAVLGSWLGAQVTLTLVTTVLRRHTRAGLPALARSLVDPVEAKSQHRPRNGETNA